MMQSLFENKNPDIPFRNEVGFNYKGKLFKVHVHKVVEGNETVFKLFFKNNIDDTNKSIMKISRSASTNGNIEWSCKADYFSVIDNDMARAAGEAIEQVLLQNND